MDLLLLQRVHQVCIGTAGRSCVLSPSSRREPLLGRNAIFSLPRFPGRGPETKALGLDKLGVQLNPETGKIVVGADESTSVPNIYAFGDIGEVRWRGRPRDRRRRPQSFTWLLFTARSRLFVIGGFVIGESWTDTAPPTGTDLQEQSSPASHLGELLSAV